MKAQINITTDELIEMILEDMPNIEIIKLIKELDNRIENQFFTEDVFEYFKREMSNWGDTAITENTHTNGLWDTLNKNL